MFYGSLVALVTPMHENGDCDFAALQQLVDFHLQQQTDGLVVLGTTGEVCTLTAVEKQKIITHVVEQVAGRIPVIVGVGSNDTTASAKAAQHLCQQGVDGLLCVTPYYNRPTQEGLYRHFMQIAQAADKPIILYNIPARSAVDLLPTTVARLAQVPHIVAIKETVDVMRVTQLLDNTDNIDVLCGNDAFNGNMLAAGAKGIISVAANVAPQLCHAMCQAMAEQNSQLAIDYHQQLLPLCYALAQQTNPIPVKWALQHLGKIGSGIRLPLTPLEKSYQPAIINALTTLTITRETPCYE